MKKIPKIKWDESKARLFRDLLNQDMNLRQINVIENKLKEINLTKLELDECTKSVTSILYSNAKKCFKVMSKIKKRKIPTNNSKTWFSKDCISMKKRLTNLSKLLLKSPNNASIRGLFFKLKKEYKKLVKSTKKCYEISNIEQLNNLTGSPKKFWNHVKKIGGRKNDIGYGNYISKEVWIDHFKSINANDPENNISNRDHCLKVKDELMKIISNGENKECKIIGSDFSNAKLLFGIKNLKKGKSCGTDVISNEIIKNSTHVLTQTLTLLFDKISKLKYFPKLWSAGLIVPIYKSGDLDDPNNFRGITLNSCMSKLFTFILNRRLNVIYDEKYIIDYNQIGFRKGFRTSDHVFTLKTLIDNTLNNKKKLYTCFVDFKKAYDSVWRDGLFLKLLQAGIGKGFGGIDNEYVFKIKMQCTNGWGY